MIEWTIGGRCAGNQVLEDHSSKYYFGLRQLKLKVLMGFGLSPWIKVTLLIYTIEVDKMSDRIMITKSCM